MTGPLPPSSSHICPNCDTHWNEVQLICPHCGAPWASSRRSFEGLTQVFRILTGLAMGLFTFTTTILACVFTFLFAAIVVNHPIIPTVGSGVTSIGFHGDFGLFRFLAALFIALSSGGGYSIYRFRRRPS